MVEQIWADGVWRAGIWWDGRHPTSTAKSSTNRRVWMKQRATFAHQRAVLEAVLTYLEFKQKQHQTEA